MVYKVILLLTIFVLSCKNETKTPVVVKKETPCEDIKEQECTFLCNIKGEAWNYTKVSGIVSQNKKTQKRTAIITFTKQLEKGKESVQLFYDGNTNILEDVQLADETMRTLSFTPISFSGVSYSDAEKLFQTK
ncbi:hypothetical protein GCM10022291_01010 [Postechiella marina]|uniref:Lipoprotein n=1 Tax=Postechiella marina TaxID=943941 RepID=A0ABP8BYS4_9FLAO